MAFTVPTFEQLRDRYLQALVNLRPEAAIGRDSDNFVRASAFAAVMEGIYAHQSWGFRQAFPDLADPDYMEKMANLRGLQRKAAIVAGGTVRISGTPGTGVPAGLQVFTSQGVYVGTSVAAIVGGDGTVDVAAEAMVPGSGANLTASTPATVSSPPTGIGSTATILTMTGGTDTESDADLLDRLELLLSEEAQGGNATDYRRWALEVPGITRVYVFDVRRGSGTVDVVPLTDTGLPSTIQLDAVQEIIDAHRPVGMRARYGALALAPGAVVANVAATLAFSTGHSLEELDEKLEEAVDSVFRALGPGETLVRAKLVTSMMNVPGVTDVTLVQPAANVTCLADDTALQLIVRGSLTLS